ncbi:hypothetical protein DPMN_153956 [Dreissena polymorpha]|uniref:HEPN domain-containing protein n=1 Tax=Dreissena polymorpha TaxID=45954 RepID=A0A9D4FNA6_DREPO|nr:hypothetical protein DPMN_153956 [Dreissena polymorpha]
MFTSLLTYLFRMARELVKKYRTLHKRRNHIKQACEKALKAAWFKKDANKCRLREHSLVRIAEGLDGEIVQKATEFEDRLSLQGQANFRLRYPDSVNSCQIPSDVFSKENATYAVTTTKTIIELVEELSR